MFKVRFNLGRGENYLKWQVKMPNKEVAYFNPEEVSIMMVNAKLVNNKPTSKKIYEGANKSVCAWIEAEYVSVEGVRSFELSTHKDKQVRYNPRVYPSWIQGDNDVDGETYRKLVTSGRNVYEF
jgi:hypothetical protein